VHQTLLRIGHDIRNRRNLESYVVSGITLAFAAMSLFGDFFSDNLRWAICTAGIGLLVYRLTVPPAAVTPGRVLDDRLAFDEPALHLRLAAAREVWLFAPSGKNFLSSLRCEVLRRHVLGRPDGAVRVVVLDPGRRESLRTATRQLTESVEYPIQRFPESLTSSLDKLRAMTGWPVPGSFSFRLLDYNPGFSIVAIDPGRAGGLLIVEFHGFHNESSSSRMHLVLTRAADERWYAYWMDQFEHIWRAAAEPAERTGLAS
jgi:hypothetical protein